MTTDENANPSNAWHDGLSTDEANHRAALARSFQLQVGPRHRRCTWRNFEVTTSEQQAVVAALRSYVADFDEHLAAGAGVVLSGRAGCGKDHLFATMGVNVALHFGVEPRWISGVELWGSLRDAIGRDRSESEVLSPLQSAGVLVLSDPCPPAGTLTDYQAAQLLRLVDCRYRNLRPTWVSLNVSGRAEANERLGVAVVDRLRDGALCLACGWPSFRQPLATRDE